MTTVLERHLIGDVSKSALVKAEGSEKLLMPVIRDRVKVVEDGEDYTVRVVDTEGSPRIDAKTGTFMTINALVEELKTDPEYAQAFKSTAVSGSGVRVPTKQTQVRVAPDRSGMTATERIKAGLAKGQFETSRRGS
jgi:hypothetical protein